jgi:hypothetical protein
MEKITFSGTLLYIDDKQLNVEDFKKKLPEKKYSITIDKKVHSYDLSYSENYLKVTFGDGSAMPRNPTVYDVITKESTPNPRQSNQVEQKETFGLIDFNTSFLWLSNSKKRQSFIDFLRPSFMNKGIVSKDIYDEEKFIQTIKKLDSIKISAEPELFSQSQTLAECLSAEISGYEATVASLQFQYTKKNIGKNLLEKIKSILRGRNCFRGVTISGRDENNLGMLFNANVFSRKIEFKAPVNEMFLADDVFCKLITKIEDERN